MNAMPHCEKAIRIEMSGFFQRLHIEATHGTWGYNMAEPRLEKSLVRQAGAWVGRGVIPQ